MVIRYDPTHIEWLSTSVDQFVQGKAGTVEEACETLLDEWNKKTGRTGTVDRMIGTYYRHKKSVRRAAAPFGGGYDVAPGNVVVVVETGKTFAQVFPDMEAAIHSVNGRLSEFTFYEATKLRVGLKTIAVVEKA